MKLEYKTTVRATDNIGGKPLFPPAYTIGRMVENEDSEFSNWIFCAVPKVLIEEPNEREFGDLFSYTLCFGNALHLFAGNEKVNKDFPATVYRFRLFPPHGIASITDINIELETILLKLKAEVK